MTRPSSWSAPLLAGLTAAALVSTGCAGLGGASGPGAGVGAGVAAVDLDRPEMRQFAVANMTELERDVRIETGDRKYEGLTPALFWTGITVGTATTAGAIVFGVLGFTTKKQLNSGYEGDGLTLDERDRLVSKGEGYNTAAVALTTVAVISYALAIVTYGVDWNRCGPLVRKSKKRHCDQP
jgi:hypothetical protein